ncbi:deoxyguanosinetriphosphate triphosphohydrolase family protein [Mycetocola spongiae]|uniref:deoxyguanosinetriphosphate triphosphohydrolase family protein n=1 Tax=Mycetocola spongiae TaxID=2859226 RepID=UPI001CF36BEC|nr:dNTP triphosphohydrolase [Mycetocola spongiae]UCR88017.1 dNTP triphosphohydrolase [Mycetocola spongiae]
MSDQILDPRQERVIAEPVETEGRESRPYRIDLERLRFSPYFSRLSAVTQVIPQASVGPVIHNRLTHSIKVTSVAREIAVSLVHSDPQTRAILDSLGGCDPVVVQAAASAHDLGHPPFGHLGEQVLDRVARERLGLPEGFEGNAQTFRILTELDTHGAAQPGLNLTAAVRAAVLKYPWTRLPWATENTELAPELRPRGVGDVLSTGAHKFSIYSLHEREIARVRAAYPAIAPWQQTVECSVMDIADDIAYSLHDLDDFYRAGVLQHASVSSELRTWLRSRSALAALDRRELEADTRTPGNALELLRRRALSRDSWIADDEAFRNAVDRVNRELVDGLLAVPFDGGINSERALSAFIRRWLDRFQRSIVVEATPHVRSGHVRLERQAWHDVMVLKFVHSRFVLDNPDLATAQRGQARLVESLVLGLDEWLRDPHDAFRAPRRLLESAEDATESYFELRESTPESLSGPTDDLSIHRRGRGRAIVDYVASLTDAQAQSMAALMGTSRV